MVNAHAEWNKFASRFSNAQSRVKDLQDKIQMQTMSVQSEPAKFKEQGFQLSLENLQGLMNLWTFLQSLFKSFMEYWKEQMDDGKNALKTALAFSQSARG